MLMKIGFDNDKYLAMQSAHIRERIAQFDNKLYLEFGGKLFDDYHASRVLPGFQPDSKLQMLLQLKEQAEVVIVGEAPGANADKQGEPFVGRAGKLLDDMLAMIGLDRSRIYITNSVKCRPPQNRDPLNTEKEACSGYLRRQMELMQPKILVCLGRISAMEMIKPDFKITREHGQWFEKNGFQMMAVYHPAALLRDPRRRPESFEDFKGLQQKINELCEHTHAVS